MKKEEYDSYESHYLSGMKRLVAISKGNEVNSYKETNNSGKPKDQSKHVCLVCGHMWGANWQKKEGPKKCPKCSSILWNRKNLKHHKCKQCSHGWVSDIEKPIMCPCCKSKLWNKDAGRYVCKNCGSASVYNLERGPPGKCRKCGSPICQRTQSDVSARSADTVERQTNHAEGSDREHLKQKKNGAFSNITPRARAILESDADDTRKIVELTNEGSLDFSDAEILVRHKNGEDDVSIARTTNISLNRVIMTIASLSYVSDGEGAKKCA